MVLILKSSSRGNPPSAARSLCLDRSCVLNLALTDSHSICEPSRTDSYSLPFYLAAPYLLPLTSVHALGHTTTHARAFEHVQRDGSRRALFEFPASLQVLRNNTAGGASIISFNILKSQSLVVLSSSPPPRSAGSDHSTHFFPSCLLRSLQMSPLTLSMEFTMWPVTIWARLSSTLFGTVSPPVEKYKMGTISLTGHAF